jgi:ribosomal protein S18 acetylase RimI-like enzyme
MWRARRIQKGVRPFDVYHDLKPVVELIAVAFGDKLDPAGQVVLAGMRRTARRSFLWGLLWPLWGGESIAQGLVWVEEGRVVGNVSLRRASQRGGFLIGNVVVHPDWQGQGIASELMEAALEEISARGGRWVGLEVQTDNPVALRLYERLGFQEVGSTLHMLCPAGLSWDGDSVPQPALRRGRGRDGAALVKLMRAVVPAPQRPLLDLRERDYRPGWRRTLEHWLEGRRQSWWVIEEDGAICGAVRALCERGNYPDRLEVLVAPGRDGRFEAPLVHKGMACLRGASRKRVETLLPNSTESLTAALKDIGFQKLRVLVQMRLNLGNRIPVTG